MKVILLRDIRQTGKRGEEVDVKPGYARNYLLPQRLAVEASEANRNWFEQEKEKIDARAAEEREQAAEVAKKIHDIRVEITKRVGETETLYGSVTATEIAEALEDEGVTVDKRKIDVGGGIKSIGDHHINIYLHPEVTADLVVTVLPEE